MMGKSLASILILGMVLMSGIAMGTAEIVMSGSYLQEVSGYNRAKQQEVKDRTRYNALTGAISH